MTPAELRHTAADLEEKAKAALHAGQTDQAELLVYAAWKARDLADRRDREIARRQDGSQSDTLRGMQPAARVRISKGAKRTKETSELQKLASLANHTLRSISEALGCSNVFLSKALRGDKAIRESWAKAVQEMTRSKEYPVGFAATRRNWPAGWAREPKQ